MVDVDKTCKSPWCDRNPSELVAGAIRMCRAANNAILGTGGM